MVLPSICYSDHLATLPYYFKFQTNHNKIKDGVLSVNENLEGLIVWPFSN